MTWTRRKLVRAIALGAVATAGSIAESLVKPSGAVAAEDAALTKRFEYLSQNGNSNCSREFMDSIAAMPVTAMIQGSCCNPMDLHRYGEQVAGLRKYRGVPLIPSDPYDIPAGLAAKLLASYAVELTPAQQAGYDYAMANSDEKGPCCCQCWRWHVYGGLAKILIREHGYSGEQVTEVWNLSNGCGGGAEHLHL